MTDELQVETTGETVGEAKWQALRELERLHPGLDKSAVRFQVVSEGERGLLGVGFAPARVVAMVDSDSAPPALAPTDESAAAARTRELLERFAGTLELQCRVEIHEDAESDHRFLLRPGPRPSHRQARPDDRRAAVPRERDRAPRPRRR